MTNYFTFRDSFTIGEAQAQVLILDSVLCHIHFGAIELAEQEIYLSSHCLDQVPVQAFRGLSFTKAAFPVKPSNFPPALEQALDRASKSRPDILKQSFREKR